MDMTEFVNNISQEPSVEEIDKKILDPLNPEQKQAAMVIDGPLRILAGAGTGKTKTVTHRIAYLINHGIEPSSILAITFTNKSANEFRERLVSLIPDYKAYSVTCGTIHGIFARLLREYAEYVGYTDQYAILDESDSTHVMEDMITYSLYGDTESKVEKELMAAIKNGIWHIKSDHTYRDELDELVRDGDILPESVNAYKEYQSYLKSHNVMDFDDLLLNMYDLLNENPNVLEELQDRFMYIIVDEYQDTSSLQDVSIKMIAKKHRNLCVIGDDDQSIYGWRNADPSLMLNFANDFPDLTEVKLEENYRSTSTILDAANQVIANNKVRLGKSLRANNKDNTPIYVANFPTSLKQADYVAKQIREYHKQGIPYSQMAILYRRNNSSWPFEREFTKCGIPYELYSGTPFFGHESVKDLTSYARILISSGPETDLALQRIINKPSRGISDKAFDVIEALATARNTSYIHAVNDIVHAPNEDKVKTLCANFIKGFVTPAKLLNKNANIGDVFNALYQTSGYNAAIDARKSKHSGDKLEKDISDESNIQSCIEMAYEFDAAHRGDTNELNKSDNSKEILRMFLEYAALAANKQNDTGDCVQMLTMHKSKGLEFTCVFAIDLCDGIIPSARDESINNEEERRLMYVTITRAKKFLHLTYPTTLMLYGKRENCIVSPFVKEINPSLLKHV